MESAVELSNLLQCPLNSNCPNAPAARVGDKKRSRYGNMYWDIIKNISRRKQLALFVVYVLPRHSYKQRQDEAKLGPVWLRW